MGKVSLNPDAVVAPLSSGESAQLSESVNLSEQPQSLPPPDCQYLIAEKNKVVVVTIIGNITGRFETELNRCINDIDRAEPVLALINFREVFDTDGFCITFLAQLKKVLRKRPHQVGFCGIKPSLLSYLLSQGVLAKNEVFNNLKDALLKFSGNNR